jgi:peptidyl-prolyl cis-trans isomerase D
MSTSIGKITKSFLVKILVAIIILPFVFWGMGDVFRGGNQNIVASIDSNKVSTQEFMNYLNRLNLKEADRKNIKNSNLLTRILSEFLGRKIIELEVEEVGIKVTDNSLKNIILNDSFFKKDGKFSRTTYEKFLIESGLTAPAFEENIATQEKRRQLLSYLGGGIILTNSLVEKEFKKENQIKTIKYIDLNNFYKKNPPTVKEMKEIFNKNEKIFIENFKNINFAEITPEALIGKKEYEQSFFDKINIIENETLDGKNLKEISLENNLKIVNTGNLNKEMINNKGIKFTGLTPVLFNKFFNLKNLKSTELITDSNKYYLVEISSIDKRNLKFNNVKVQESIKSQLTIQNKLNNNGKIIQKISSEEFDLKQFENYANKNALDIKLKTISNLKNDEVFNEDLVKNIFSLNNNQINLITDSMLSQNFLVYVEKTEYKKLDINSDAFRKYKSQAKLNFAQEIYKNYDKSVNNKYSIDINDKAVNRIKNSF